LLQVLSVVSGSRKHRQYILGTTNTPSATNGLGVLLLCILPAQPQDPGKIAGKIEIAPEPSALGRTTILGLRQRASLV
jgi:hypothetical protein